MTWRLKVQGVVFATVALGALAAASGAGWTDIWAIFSYFGW
ncbi:MAG TPA: hypothetical protein VEM94_01845 [Candidatus Dormibacteraeota bacterium]|jgi:hypothetical protein|nr:hypothetical protein [Candidatus Dormibacteraeota bacterium]